MNKQKICDFIAKHEGYRSKKYTCPAGYLTIGYGHKCTNSTPNQINLDTANKYLCDDVDVVICQFEGFLYTNGLSHSDIHLLSDSQITSIISFIFNLGIGKFEKYSISSLILIYIYSLKIGKPDDVIKSMIVTRFTQYCYSNHKQLPGLLNRRLEEAHLFSL